MDQNRYMFYSCDVCESYPLTECRWHCNVCEDFDMCDACYQLGDKHDPTHSLTRIPIDKSLEEKNDPKEVARATQLRRQNSTSGFSKDSITKFEDVMDENNLRKNNRISTVKAEEFLEFYEFGLEKYEDLLNKENRKIVVPERRLIAATSLLLSSVAPKDGILGQNRISQNQHSEYKSNPALALPLFTTLVRLIMQSDKYKWFWEPVDSAIPNYHSKIKNPMDLGTILNRLNNGEYIKKLNNRNYVYAPVSKPAETTPAAKTSPETATQNGVEQDDKEKSKNNDAQNHTEEVTTSEDVTETEALTVDTSPPPTKNEPETAEKEVAQVKPSTPEDKWNKDERLFKLLASDLELVWNNALDFNGPESGVYLLAKRLREKTSMVLLFAADAMRLQKPKVSEYGVWEPLPDKLPSKVDEVRTQPQRKRKTMEDTDLINGSLDLKYTKRKVGRPSNKNKTSEGSTPKNASLYQEITDLKRSVKTINANINILQTIFQKHLGGLMDGLNSVGEK